MLRRFDLIAVTWLDHVGLGPQWTEVSKVKHKPAEFTTVGYFLHADGITVTLGSTLDRKQKETGDVTIIVSSCITRILALEVSD